MIEEYEINEDTQAIIPINEHQSRVYEKEEEYIVNMPSNKIISYNCSFYGSSYNGRCEGTKSLIGIKTKYPIIIEESRKIIFFPTSSTRGQQTNWISLNNIKNYDKDEISSIINFKNGKKLPIDISYYSLNNQYYRAMMLKQKLYERILKEK